MGGLFRMKKLLRLLIVEDSEFDAQMMVTLLRKDGYDVQSKRVETAAALKSALSEGPWDLILADYNLPEFNALTALSMVKESGLDLPFIIVSGGIGEDIAVAAMKAGAHDYLMKGNLSRLAPAVDRELREAAVRASQKDAEAALHESETRYRLLWQSSPDAVILMDSDGQIQFANPAVLEIFGYAPEEVTGQNLALILPESLRRSHDTALERYLKTGHRHSHWRATETMGRRKDGLELPIEVSFSDMDLKGQRRYVGFIRDISARKQAEHELRQHAEQFRVAREIQQRLFPKSAPEVSGFDIGGASYPAEATGGDYFDFLPMLHDGLGIILGDVSGHGIGPALLMAETRAYLRVLVGRREDVGEILTRANGILAEDVGQERFITMFLARLNAQRRSMNYASAGHPAGYLLDAAGKIKAKLPRTGMPLGIRPDTHFSSSQEIPLTTGDLILLTTDGIEETLSPKDEFFSIERTLDAVRAHQHLPAREIVEALYQATRAFSGNAPQADDITSIVIKVTA